MEGPHRELAGKPPPVW